MLQSLYVKNLALIKEIEVGFNKGLNILTGETGAGKSIIIGGVNLALGARYSRDILRAGSEFGLVELTFKIDRPEIITSLHELDIYPEENILVLSRKLMDGRSVSKINGETVQMGLLREVSSLLIDIHGQHEHQSLLNKSTHLKILDLFIGSDCEILKNSIKNKYLEYSKAQDELAMISKNRKEKERELSLLEFEISEISESQLKIGEDVDLENKYRFMLNAKRIQESMQTAYVYLDSGNESCTNLLSKTIKDVSDCIKYDKNIEMINRQLLDIESLLNDVNRDMSTYLSELEFSDEEYTKIEGRLNLINKLKSKYGSSIDDILEYKEIKEREVAQIKDLDNYLSNLDSRIYELKKVLLDESTKLTKLRKNNAEDLEKQIKANIEDLNFGDTMFKISFTLKNSVSENGMDDVEFMISLNKGEVLKPLVSIASGGELSRIMLAIKTVMAVKDDISTLIFDEIDVGISGRTAQKVSEKMSIIAKTHQILCITHLPQITAMADSHYLIEKVVKDDKTTTEIKFLNRDESIIEIARMSGGAKITDNVIDNAKEMKDLADLSKSKL
ncbi:MAG: DNA repair protein RecN [Suipraeoptans sp.]